MNHLSNNSTFPRGEAPSMPELTEKDGERYQMGSKLSNAIAEMRGIEPAQKEIKGKVEQLKLNKVNPEKLKKVRVRGFFKLVASVAAVGLVGLGIGAMCALTQGGLPLYALIGVPIFSAGAIASGSLYLSFCADSVKRSWTELCSPQEAIEGRIRELSNEKRALKGHYSRKIAEALRWLPIEIAHVWQSVPDNEEHKAEALDQLKRLLFEAVMRERGEDYNPAEEANEELKKSALSAYQKSLSINPRYKPEEIMAREKALFGL